VADPYARNMFGQFNPYYAKIPVPGRLVVVLDGIFEERGLQLIRQSSRAIKKNEVHEFIITDEQAKPGDTVNRIAYLGFAEFSAGGVVIVGDPVFIENQQVGRIAGFDETHMPNHLNIVLSGNRKPGKEWGVALNDQILIGKG